MFAPFSYVLMTLLRLTDPDTSSMASKKVRSAEVTEKRTTSSPSNGRRPKEKYL